MLAGHIVGRAHGKALKRLRGQNQRLNIPSAMMVRGSVRKLLVTQMGYWGMDPLKEVVLQIRPALQVQRTQMAVEVKEYFGIVLVIIKLRDFRRNTFYFFITIFIDLY